MGDCSKQPVNKMQDCHTKSNLRASSDPIIAARNLHYQNSSRSMPGTAEETEFCSRLIAWCKPQILSAGPTHVVATDVAANACLKPLRFHLQLKSLAVDGTRRTWLEKCQLWMHQLHAHVPSKADSACAARQHMKRLVLAVLLARQRLHTRSEVFCYAFRPRGSQTKNFDWRHPALHCQDLALTWFREGDLLGLSLCVSELVVTTPHDTQWLCGHNSAHRCLGHSHRVISIVTIANVLSRNDTIAFPKCARSHMCAQWLQRCLCNRLSCGARLSAFKGSGHGPGQGSCAAEGCIRQTPPSSQTSTELTPQ